ncbi:MAG: FG-GAP-like repeat-containing protein [Bacteroidota bacterium]
MKTHLKLWLLSFLLIPFGAHADVLLTQHVIQRNAGGACSITAADFDGDGDTDLALTASTDGTVFWMKNDGNQNFTQQSIRTGYTQARALFGTDIDLDGDVDLVATAFGLTRFSWFKNDGRGHFTEQVITNEMINLSWVVAGDIDLDGDTDLAVAACDLNQVGWFENDGTCNFTYHAVKTNWTKANCIIIKDMDGDGDMDLVGTAKAGNIIIFKNPGNQQFTELEICANWGSPSSVQAGDLDGDGDMDLVATSCGSGDMVGWFENVGGDRFNRYTLKDKYDGSRQCEITDLDQDGDLDILSIAWTSSVVTLFENRGNHEFREYQFCNDAYDMLKLYVVDLDRDNDLDIAGACFGDNEIRWWENVNEFMSPGIENENESGHFPLTVEFRDRSSARPAIEAYEWDLNGDGIIDSNEPNPVFTYSQPGYYNVSLTIRNSLNSCSITRENMIRVFDGNSAIELDGTAGYLDATPISPRALTNGFGFECWIKPFTYGGASAGHLMQKDKIKVFLYESGTLVPNSHCLALFMTHADGTISKVCTPAESIKMNEWQHIFAGYDALTSTVSIYIDGVLQTLTEAVAPAGSLNDAGDKPFTFGNTDRRTRTFNGVMEEIRIWETPQNQNNILARMNSVLSGAEPGLIGYWQLNEGTGLVTEDITHLNTSTLKQILWAQGKSLNSSGIETLMAGGDNTLIRFGPNPFAQQEFFTVTTDEPALVSVEILDVTGKIIYRFPDYQANPGQERRIMWNSLDSAGNVVLSGIYLAHFVVGSEHYHIKLFKN